MEWIKNLKISHKLMILILLSLIFVTLVGAVGYFYNAKSTQDIASLYNDRLIPIRDLSQMSINSNTGNADLLAMLLSDTTQKKKNYYADLKTRGAENTALLKTYEATKLVKEEQDVAPVMNSYRMKYIESREKVAQFAFAGKVQEGLAVYRSETKPAFQGYIDSLNKLVEINKNIAEQLHKQSEKDAITANIIILVTLISSFVMLLTLGLMISRMITKPIEAIIESLNEGASLVASASEQLSAASHQLAEGSSEQAASIQETSASVEESDSMVKQNTENTQEAASLAKKTKDYAVRSNEKMDGMMATTEVLKKSSDEIAKIIKVIDEIAFQTNILALNAAVEAARAGDAGKGFAVVAEEVRNLAQKCAQATKDTSGIIQKNVDLSSQSAEATKEISADIKAINDQAQKVSDLLNEIAVASKEQAQGISQINTAISQMEQVVQANASTAEESAAASSELSSQAVNLKGIVNELFVIVEGADALQKKS